MGSKIVEQSRKEFTFSEHLIQGEKLSRIIDMSHLAWSFDTKGLEKLAGNVISRAVGPLRITWVNMTLGDDGFRGWRTQYDIDKSPEKYLTIVMPIKGYIKLKTVDKSIRVNIHELAIWDSNQCIDFEITDSEYEHISVIIPQRLLRADESRCRDLHCSHLDESNLLSELCVQHMTTLSKFLDKQLRPYEISLSNVTVNIVHAVLASFDNSPRDKGKLLEEIKDYIDCYISDETLSPSTISAAFQISTRYVHKIFEKEEYKIGAWIVRRRLERSRTDLTSVKVSITSIAFRWGFKDHAHYSRAFKKYFGITPSKYRNIYAK